MVPSLTLYRYLTDFSILVLRWYLKSRLRRGKEEYSRLNERFGEPSLMRRPGPLLWLHAASIGESLSVIPLIEVLLDTWPSLSVLITTVTVPAAKVLTDYLPSSRIYHQYIPLDRLVFFQRFLDYWHPDLVLWTESEFWPNAILSTRSYGIPMILVNGRLSERSFRRWKLFWPQGIRSMLACFELCLCQTQQDCHRLIALGAQRVDCVGNLKFSNQPLPVNPEALMLAQYNITANRWPVWLAASTHAGEEIIVGHIHKNLVKKCYPRLLTIVVPRHPARGVSIASELRSIGLNVARRSTGETVQPETAIYIADTFGELGLFFRLAPLTFLGKSLVARGGQNPLEPARLGCAVLFGPHMSNFLDISAKMVSVGAARTVSNAAHLEETVETLLGDLATCTTMGMAGRELASAETTVLSHIVFRLMPYLSRLKSA